PGHGRDAHATCKPTNRTAVPLYLVATALFVLALLTKTVTATLPAALLVVIWWQRGRLEWKRDVTPLALWFALGVAAGLFTAWFEHTIIGARGEDFALGPVERLLLAGRVVWFYFGKLLWPHPLIFIYPRWHIDANASVQYLFPIAAMAIVAGLVVLAFRRDRRAPLAVALLYGGTLVPVLGFVNVYPFIYSFVADHFQYHASLAVFAGGAAALTLLAPRFLKPTPTWIIATALIVGLSSLSWRQAHMYRDVVALYEATLARNPDAWMAHTNLGITLVESGQAAAALPHYREALRLRPNYAEGENNLGFALTELGRPSEALVHLRRALELRPDYPQARNNLAGALIATGRTEEGVEVFRETLQLYPGDGDAHFNLGLALARVGRADEALAYFEQAARIDPDNAKYVLHVGTALMFNQRLDEAVVQFRRAVELDPNSAVARYTFGRALFDHRRYAEAIVELQAALRVDDSFAETHATLGSAFEAVGRFAEAQAHSEIARSLRSGTRH
ncbi:MAG TPA: tetratricopeptide repeat protein, partial [Candidatus Synoicihabitans sp.]|nr:tetratricopeptide repeat protein [Candidatus Synoicihabitans sp.]